MLGPPKSEVSFLLSLFGDVFDSLCDTGKAHFFSEPQFPYRLGLLLLASLLQRVPEWVGLRCCGSEGLNCSGPFPSPTLVLPLPPQRPSQKLPIRFCFFFLFFFSPMVSWDGELLGAEGRWCITQRSASPGREGPAQIWGRAQGPRSHVLRAVLLGADRPLGKEKRPGLEEGAGRGSPRRQVLDRRDGGGGR